MQASAEAKVFAEVKRYDTDSSSDEYFLGNLTTVKQCDSSETNLETKRVSWYETIEVGGAKIKMKVDTVCGNKHNTRENMEKNS